MAAKRSPSQEGKEPVVARKISDRQASQAQDQVSTNRQVAHGGPRGQTAAGKPGRRGSARPSMGLRAKFMLVLCGLTAAALISLGAVMAGTTYKYLFSQKQHDGIEVARMAAAVASSVASRLETVDVQPGRRGATEVQKEIREYLLEAINWGPNLQGASDIIQIRFNVPSGRFSTQLQGAGIGEDEDGASIRSNESKTIFIPKLGSDITLPANIQVYEVVRTVKGQEVPAYRFRVALDPARFGGMNDPDSQPHVRVDIDRRSVVDVRNHLFFAIILAVILAMIAVVLTANWLARQIIGPVEILLKDMQVVASGNLEHVTKSHSSDEIGSLALEFNRMTQDLAVAQSALVEQEKQAYELQMAREVQRHLLPADSPSLPGFDLAAHYQGAKAVSGDYFDFIPLDDGLWGFIVADVSGKGIPGSMVMAVTRTIVRLTATKNKRHPAETLKETNRLIAKQIKRGMFVTVFYAVLDEKTSTLTYACAGHNPMVIYRAASRSRELATGKGIAVGFNEGPIFDRTIEEHRTQLASGDAFVLYTDGFPEAMNEKNEEFGEERFYNLIAANGHLEPRILNGGLVNEVAKHRGKAEQSDDLTLISVRRVPE